MRKLQEHLLYDALNMVVSVDQKSSGFDPLWVGLTH